MKIVKTTNQSRPVILVTGGGGYIGSHACKALKKAGYIPVTFDNFSTGWKEAVKFGPLVEGDLLDKKSLTNTFQKYKPDAVMHFAALSSVKESILKPELYWSNNVMGSLNLLSAMKDYNCQKLVLSSTAAVYGQPEVEAITESTPKNPINPYGSSKLAVESMAKSFEPYGIRSISLRYFNVAGADPDAEIGECHIPETHLIPLILKATLDPQGVVTIFGNDYPTPDGTCIRDYIHVIDLISAHTLALDYLSKGGPSTYINLGTEEGFSVQEVIETVQKVVEAPIKVQIGNRRGGDPPRLVCKNNLAKRVLGWNPKYSVLEKMIQDAWKWENTNQYSSDKKQAYSI